jgi:hypothetical protein
MCDPPFNDARTMKDDRSGVFVVGRIDKTGRRVVFVNEPAQPPFPGPWELHAVFTL